MFSDATIVFIILAVTIVMFLTEALALDLIGLLSLLALYFANILTPQEALSGFSNPVVITLGALFLVGGALFRTGVAASIGDWLGTRGGDSVGRLVASIMVLSALLSAFMSSTGTVAILIPAVLGVAKKNGISPAKLMMPLAYGCLIGGMLTLVGTAPNLVVQEALVNGGFEKFSFFSFTPAGVLVLLVGIVYMSRVGVKFFPDTDHEDSKAGELSTDDLAGEYRLGEHVARFRVKEDSSLAGQRLAETDLRSRYALNLVGIQRKENAEKLVEPTKDSTIEAHDILHFHGPLDGLQKVPHGCGLEVLSPQGSYREITNETGLAELLLTPRSRLIGQTLKTSRFQDRYGVNVIALKRRGRVIEEPSHHRLGFGDTLLVVGPFRALEMLYSERDNFVVTGMPEENQSIGLRRNKAWIAVLLVVLMLGLMTFNVVPSVMAVLLVAGLALLFGCLSSEDGYRSISWQSLLLIAFMLPMASALEKTGGVDLIAGGLTNFLGQFGPRAVLAGLFLLTSLFSQFISNTATTVIVAPIAMEAAVNLGLAPHAFLMAVAVAASSAFVTPVASPVNMLVMAPGKYGFRDFVKVGLPLQAAVLLLAMIVLPMIFPFQ